MKINIKETLINKFIETKELNVLIANIYNTYFEECRKSIDEFSIIKHSGTNCPIYFALLEALEIDPSDFEFQQLSKQYHLDEIKKLNEEEYLNDAYLKNIKFEDKEFSNYSLRKNFYAPYECFLYEEVTIKPTAFYKEISHLGYFDKLVPYFELIKGDKILAEINPYEINIVKNDLSTMKGNILIAGLGLGYLAYSASLKSDVSSIDIYEKDETIIKLIEPLIKNHNEARKIKLINKDLMQSIDSLDTHYDYIYFDLCEVTSENLIKYIKIKKLEDKFNSTKFLFKNESTLLTLLRRYIVVLFEENLEGFTSKDYQKASNDDDKIIISLYKTIEKEVFNNRQSIDKLLSDESLKTLVKKLNL